jgi:hypothetical protein
MQCLVHVIGGSFTFLSAVGAGFLGFGGCLLVRESQLLVRGSSFEGSQALLGGAVCCLTSDIDCRQCWFTGNLAFFDGGSIVCQFDNVTSGESYAQDKLAFFEGCDFADSTSKEVHGAIGIDGIHDATLDGCRFVRCSAVAEGGAVGCVNSNLLVVRSRFVNNTVGRKERTGRTNAKLLDGDTQEREKRASGGAISVITLEVPPAGDHNVMANGETQYQFATQDCCFIGNHAQTGSFDVYLGGVTKYQSFNDKFGNYRAAAIQVEPGSFLAAYHALFYEEADSFPEDCRADLAESPQTVASFLYTETTDAVGEPVTDDLSQPANTAWATRVPPATPFGRTLQTEYTIEQNLSVPPYVIPSSPTATVAATPRPSETFVPPPAQTDVPPQRTSVPPPAQTELPTMTPEATQIGVLSETVSLSMSLLTMAFGNITQVTTRREILVDFTTHTASAWHISSLLGGEITFSQTVIASFYQASISSLTFQLIEISVFIPVYTAVPLAMFVPVTNTQDTKSDGLGNAVIIGVSCGGAAVLAIIIGLVLFVVRHKGQGSSGESDGGEPGDLSITEMPATALGSAENSGGEYSGSDEGAAGEVTLTTIGDEMEDMNADYYI